MSSVEAKERVTVDKASCTCTVADEDPVELVVGGLFKDRDAVGVAGNDILAIFREGLICRFVCAIVELVSSLSCFECHRIADFNAKLTVYVLCDVNRTVRGLIFELFRDIVGDIATSCLGMTSMIEAEAGMLIIVLFDTVEGSSAKHCTMEMPKAPFRLANDGILRDAGPVDFVFESVVDCVLFAHIFKGVNVVEGSPNEKRRWSRHTHAEGHSQCEG